MILLLGGTSESALIAAALLDAGHEVLVSTATDVPLDLPERARRRAGRLDEAGMARLVREADVTVIVDATHPYAYAAHDVALHAAEQTGVPCIRWVRPASNPDDGLGVSFALTHEEAARTACRSGRNIFLTVGSRHLAPYAAEAAARGCRLVARVLPAQFSLDACRIAGIASGDIIAARGPFTVEENQSAIREFGLDVLVTKDSGVSGGLPAKMSAAQLEHCQIVVVRRQAEVNHNQVNTLAELLNRVRPGA
jgi:precorrin-6A/cobalt-precorrin-6A reductase